MLGRSLEKEQLKQKASPRLQKRVLQVAEDEAVSDYACMPAMHDVWLTRCVSSCCVPRSLPIALLAAPPRATTDHVLTTKQPGGC